VVCNKGDKLIENGELFAQLKNNRGSTLKTPTLDHTIQVNGTPVPAHMFSPPGFFLFWNQENRRAEQKSHGQIPLFGNSRGAEPLEAKGLPKRHPEKQATYPKASPEVESPVVTGKTPHKKIIGYREREKGCGM